MSGQPLLRPFEAVDRAQYFLEQQRRRPVAELKPGDLIRLFREKRTYVAERFFSGIVYIDAVSDTSKPEVVICYFEGDTDGASGLTWQATTFNTVTNLHVIDGRALGFFAGLPELTCLDTELDILTL